VGTSNEKDKPDSFSEEVYQKSTFFGGS